MRQRTKNRVGPLNPPGLLALAAFVIVLIALPASALAEATRPPNIVLLLVDDMRFDFMSNAGHPYVETPNLDRLARDGTKYTRAYVTSPLCAPSRGSLLTGRMPSRHGVVNAEVVRDRDYPAGPFIPELIQEAGYRTAMIGKWYQGSLAPRPAFDRWFVNAGVPQLNDATPEQRRAHYLKSVYHDMLYRDGDRTRHIKRYNTDVLYDEAERFVGERSDRPFFLFLSLFAPHPPTHPAPRHEGRYSDRGVPPSPTLDLEALPPHQRRRAPRWAEQQAEMMLSIDEGLGELIEALERRGELENTLIVFTSDNGFVFGEHGRWAKRMPWEEVVRAPLIVRWPGVVPAGVEDDRLVSLADVAVTCAAVAGAEVRSVYGRSMMPLWRDEGKPIREDVLIQQYPPGKEDLDTPEWVTLVTSRYKYTAYSDDRPSLLFDLREDPHETNNLADTPETEDVQQRLADVLRRRLKETEASHSWVK